MLLCETVELCPVCEERTPHVRRRVAIPWAIAGGLVAGAVASFLWAGAGWPVGLALLFGAGLLLLRDRESAHGIACTRCRGRALAELRATKPRLDGSTEIHIV